MESTQPEEDASFKSRRSFGLRSTRPADIHRWPGEFRSPRRSLVISRPPVDVCVRQLTASVRPRSTSRDGRGPTVARPTPRGGAGERPTRPAPRREPCRPSGNTLAPTRGAALAPPLEPRRSVPAVRPARRRDRRRTRMPPMRTGTPTRAPLASNIEGSSSLSLRPLRGAGRASVRLDRPPCRRFSRTCALLAQRPQTPRRSVQTTLGQTPRRERRPHTRPRCIGVTQVTVESVDFREVGDCRRQVLLKATGAGRTRTLAAHGPEESRSVSASM
jgi:hypothetical protein